MIRRILFVDDSQEILDGLRVMLRRQRHDWDMTFVESGRLALQAMEALPYDVIVSDIRMPEMDGVELLEEVQRRHPQVVRVVLSGYSEMDTALRAIPVAHQFLDKPSSQQQLRSVIGRACRLRDRLADEALRNAVGAACELPTVPSVYVELNRCIADENKSLVDIAVIVESDIALAAKILQLVNSAFFGLARRVMSVHHATTILGATLTQSLARSLKTHQLFKIGSPRLTAHIEALQVESLLGARITSRMFDEPRHRDDAYTAGMLRDVGQLVLASLQPEAFRARIDQARELRVPLHQLEAEEGGVSHADVGAYLLELWGLPYPIVDAVAYHHTPPLGEVEDFRMTAAVHLGDALARQITEAPDAPLEITPAHVDMETLVRSGLAEDMDLWIAIAQDEAKKGSADG